EAMHKTVLSLASRSGAWRAPREGAGLACTRPSRLPEDNAVTKEVRMTCPPAGPATQADGSLEAVLAFVSGFVVLSTEQALAVTLWVVHTHALDTLSRPPTWRSRPRRSAAASHAAGRAGAARRTAVARRCANGGRHVPEDREGAADAPARRGGHDLR